MTLLEKLDRLPPCVCRLLADQWGCFKTDAQVMCDTRWSKAKVRRITSLTSWADVPVGDVDVLLSAFGLRWSSQRRERWLLRAALRKGPEGLRRMRHLRKAIAENGNSVTMSLKRTEKLLSSHA